ncbi:ATP-grasp domain-containing protein [Acinetobacter indicus]|uniref:ATP-grasp domain-containing protein n=1 Tax=Acinetobacter indicus TaxID=756892 RepID=UPI003989A67A
MKKALFLGGAYAQIPILKEAKARGWYIITCDYLPENPGHKLADEYYNLSTTDREKVFELAKKIKPDYVIAYASDPAAPVAAYVSEKLGLPGNSYASVEILSEKDKFRNFLTEHGFNVPKYLSVRGTAVDFEKLKQLRFPVVVKPTDSSGSKGVTKVESVAGITSAVDYALHFSRSQRVIIEEFIDNLSGDIHGDGFVVDGELVFAQLGDHIYTSKANPYNPTGTCWPSSIESSAIEEIRTEVARIVKLSGFNSGAINIEARFTKNNVPYVMEIGPRNGGHFVPQALFYATGFDMVSGYLDILEGKYTHTHISAVRPSAYIALNSNENGILETITLDEEIQPFINEFHQYIQPGQAVNSFQGANAAIGIVLLTFPSVAIMQNMLDRMSDLIFVKVDNV